MGVNDYVGTRITNRPHGTLNYGPGKLNFDIDYYRQNFFQKKWLIYEESSKIR